MSESQHPIIVRGKQLKAVVGVPESTGWLWGRDPSNPFPAPRKFGENFSGWLFDELMEWAKTSNPVYQKNDSNR